MTRNAFIKIIGAIAAIALCVGACCACDNALGRDAKNETSAHQTVQSTPAAHIETMKILLDNEGTDTSSAAEKLFDLSIDAELPESFAQEALDIAAFEEGYTSGPIISLSYLGSRSEAATYCSNTLKAKGWYALDQNNEITSSFAKTEGLYRWLVLQYLAFGDKTIVLVNIVDLN